MQTIVLRCNSRSAFHLGETTLDDSSQIIHSDTLFSAWTNMYQMVHGNADSFVKNVREGHLRFSSAFHALEASNQSDMIFFIPRPLLHYTGMDNLEHAKELKKLLFISLGVWQDICRETTEGQDGLSCNLDLLGNHYVRIGSSYVCRKNEISLDPSDARNLMFTEMYSLPKVKVHTDVNEDRLYHLTCMAFRSFKKKNIEWKGHFYFFITHSLPDDEWNRCLTCLRVLADEGIGGERSSGLGQFECVQGPIVIANLDQSAKTFYMTLSLVNPLDQEDFKRFDSYELLTRGGLYSEPRMRVRMIREGAITRGTAIGRLVELSNNAKAAYRNGLGFSLNLK